MPRVRIKICGITRVEDAQVAARLGVDAIGLVFYPHSPRALTVEMARRIVLALPPFVTTVGLFVNQDAAEIERVLRQVPLSLLQFHGEESPSQCARFDRPYVKAIRMRQGIDLYQEAERYSGACGILVDAYEPSVPGGTGKCFDWDRIPKGLNKPLILAGGLDPQNVRAAVNKVCPFAVDVSSGVEAAKGVKDHSKMAEFIREVSYYDGA